MALVRWFGNDVVNRMEQMQREMNRLWSADWNPWATHANVFPAINIYDDGESYIARAELPGVAPDDIDVTVTGKTLTLRGKREIAKAAEGATYHRRERRAGEFRRAFDLPDMVDGDKVQAQFTDGILEILLPRAEQAKERKVQVKAD